MAFVFRVFSTAWPAIGLLLMVATAAHSNEIRKLDAGPDITVTYPEPAILEGVVNDNEPPYMTYGWMKSDGPGEVEFENRRSAVTKVMFTEPGQYTLALGGYDGAVAYDEVIVTVTR
jgi:hypothetical protein